MTTTGIDIWMLHFRIFSLLPTPDRFQAINLNLMNSRGYLVGIANGQEIQISALMSRYSKRKNDTVDGIFEECSS